MTDKRIRICHITEASAGGVFTHLKQLALCMDPDEVEQTFIMSSLKGPELKNQDRFFGSRLIKLDMARNIKPIDDLISMIKLCRILKKEAFDIIHCHSSKAGVIGRAAAWMTGHRIIVYTPHAFAFHSQMPLVKQLLFKKIEFVAAKLTQKIICVSKGEYRQALDSKISKPEKLTVIYNGVSIPSSRSVKNKVGFLKEFGYSGNLKIIGFLGRLSEQKDPITLLKAFAQIDDKEAVLLMMGDGELRHKSELVAQQLGIGERVQFLGNVTDIAQYLPYCDLFVSSSLWEGLPYSILEAVSFSVPVIATRIPGITDIIENRKTGLLVTPGDPIDLSNAINELLNDEILRSRLSSGALQLLQSEFKVEDMIRSLTLLYKELISKRKFHLNRKQQNGNRRTE